MLNQKAEIEEAESFELDHDTKGVPGMPPIAETICRKINDCRLFLGDLTIVGESARHSDGAIKRLPNSNVLVELGYARRAKGVERLITVMITAFGDPSGLPFDLAHLRHPIRYHLKDIKDAELEENKRALAGRIADAIQTVLSTTVANEWRKRRRSTSRQHG